MSELMQPPVMDYKRVVKLLSNVTSVSLGAGLWHRVPGHWLVFVVIVLKFAYKGFPQH
jgi:hypothetical protein